jgi:hypothetical protein
MGRVGCRRGKEGRKMRRLCLGLILLGALVCVLPGVGAPTPPPKGKDIDGANLPAHEYAGKLVTAPGADRMFTLAVTYPEIVPNPGYKPDPNIQREINRINQLQAQAAHSRNPRQVQNDINQINQLSVQLQRRIAQAQANAVKVVQRTANVDFQIEENVKVRTMVLPEAYDDKGNIKKYTPEELKELKGKDNLPGYESTVAALKPGQVVRILLKHHQAPKPTTTSPAFSQKDADKEKSLDKDKDKDLDKDKDTPKEADKNAPREGGTEKKMQVRIIVIVDDGSGTTTPPKNQKGKK